ncbi:hypothetical protein MMC20_003753 [Loxospora ochrophaea]|nr:hypothetical protein [Loxospora ochrophaea]
MEQASGFTPVRRRKQDSNDRSPALSAQVPWTAARCNRLMRPLSSRITRIRRENVSYQQAGSVVPQQHLGKDTKTPRAPNTQDFPKFPLSAGPASDNDPDWAPDPIPRKKIKRTYSSRSCSQVGAQEGDGNRTRTSALPCEIAIQIPASHKTQTQYHAVGGLEEGEGQSQSFLETDTQRWEQSGKVRGHIPPRESFRRMAKTVSPTNWMLIDGLYMGLDALLKATASSKLSTTHCARSLFSTCIRTIPKYLREEEISQEKEDPESGTDISSAVYEDLEIYGSSSRGGWKPLREVVRFHGIFNLGATVKEGLIGATVSRGLVILCLHQHAYDEAEFLIECLTTSMKPLFRPLSPSCKLFCRNTSICLSTLHDYASRSGRWAFEFRQLARMLGNRTIPIEWISSLDMIEVWNRVIQSTTQIGAHTKEAAGLLRQAISLACTDSGAAKSDQIHELRLRAHRTRLSRKRARPGSKGAKKSRTSSSEPSLHGVANDGMSKALDGTISSFLAILSTINYMSWNNESVKSTWLHRSSQDTFHEIALEALQNCDLSWRERSPEQNNAPVRPRLAMPLLAAGFMSGALTGPGEGSMQTVVFLDQVAKLADQESSVDLSASLLCAVSHCCERARLGEAFDHLQKLVDMLLHVSESRDCVSATRQLCRRMAAAAAFEFAEETNAREHLDWALEVEERGESDFSTSSCKSPWRTPARRGAKPVTGYRWEDGICEWVAKTPASTLDKAVANHCSRVLDMQVNTCWEMQLASPCQTSESSFVSSVISRSETDVRSAESKATEAPCQRSNMFQRAECARCQSRPAKVRRRCASEGCNRQEQTCSITIEDDSDELCTTTVHAQQNRPPLRETKNVTWGMARKDRAAAAAWLARATSDVKRAPHTTDWAQESEDELGT